VSDASPGRIRVLLLFGGRSSEHSISCVSAGNVLRAIDRERFEVVPVGIGTDGVWRRAPDDPDALVIVDGALPVVGAIGEEVVPPVHPGGSFLELVDGRWQPMPPVDVVFPLLHGPFGEDGTVQGLMEIAGVPYVGSGVLASAVAMDKGFTKSLLSAAGLQVGRWVSFHARRWVDDPEGVLEEVRGLGLPVFVKPCRAGSSVGVSRVTTVDGLAPAIGQALAHDPRVIVEAAVAQAREIECGVLVDEHGDLQVSSFGEIVVREGHDFYDFEAKYLDDSADLIVPADLPPAVVDQLRRLAVRGFDALGCEGLSRVDFFLPRGGEPIINEINTMPGFTAISMYPRMWGHAGLSYPDLVTALIADALRRGTGLR
jgi:D-alanine-D-alanine ligase